MPKNVLIWIILCLFALPLTAQTEEQIIEPEETIETVQTTESERITEAEEPVESGRTENRFLRLFDGERRPIIKTNNLIFGLPEFLDFDYGFDIGYEDTFWLALGLKMDYTAGPLKVIGDILFINDKKYAPAEVMVPAGSLGGFYFLLNEGGLSFSKNFLNFAAGRFRNYDEIDSPYTIFLNSNGISANTLKLRLE